MASELATNVFTPGQAPDYLGHYAELVKSIPNVGLQFLAAQQASAQNAKLNAEYQIMQQKAKAFMEMYPAFKAAQIAKLQAEAATYPYRQDLLKSQAAFQRAHANMYNPAPAGEKTRLDEIAGQIPPLPGGGAAPAPANPFVPSFVTGAMQPGGAATSAPPPEGGPPLTLENTAPNPYSTDNS